MSRVSALALFASMSVAGQAQAVVNTIIQENFDGPASNLVGSSADVGGVWTGSTKYQQNGTAPGDTSGTAYIPASIAAPGIYKLTATLNPTSGATTDWLAVGFADNAAGGGSGINVDGGTGRAWMLLRDDGRTQAFNGANTGGLAVNDPNIGNPSRVSIVIDTRNPANYIVQYFDENTPLSAGQLVGAPPITQVAISAFSMSGTFDNLILTKETYTGGTTLLSDNFTVNPPGTSNTLDINVNLAGRQGGVFATQPWRATGNVQIGNTGAVDKTILDGANVLLLAGNGIATTTRNYNRDFSFGGLEIQYDAAPDVRAGNTNSSDWVAVIVGANPNETPGVNAAQTHFGLLVRENGQFQAFDGNAVVGSGSFTGVTLEDQFYRDLRLVMTDPTDGNPFDGVGVTKIDAFYGDALYYTFTKTGGGYANNYISFQGIDIGYVDNVFIRNTYVPEPASLTLLGMAGLAMLRRRRQA